MPTAPASAPVSRRGRPGHDRAAVLQRAVELFNRQGYDATSVGDVAAALGLTKSAIYHHFPSKEALLSAALDEALDGLEAAIDRAVAGSDGPKQDEAPDTAAPTAYTRLHRAVEESVHVLVRHLPAVTLLLRVRGNSAVETAALDRRRALDDRLGELVRAAVKEGALRHDLPPDVITRLVFGTVNSLTEWYRPGGPVGADEVARFVTTLVFDGLADGDRA
jgi:AcrR family transcriptional regulator